MMSQSTRRRTAAMPRGSSGTDQSLDLLRAGTSQAVKLVTRRVRETADGTVDKMKRQARDAVLQQQERAAQRLQTVSQALRQAARALHEGDAPAFGRFAEQAADQIEVLSGSMGSPDLEEFIEDLEGWARRNPTVFLAGSFLAGVLVARFLKSSRERSSR